jgi:serine protease DegQ
LVRPAEERAYTWAVTGAPNSTFLWTAAGDVVGVTTATGAAVPFHVMGDALARVVRGDEVQFAGLGAYVVDVQHVANPSTDLFSNRQSGALIIAPTPATRALVKDGPAERAGLRAKDMLLAVDGVAIHSESPLADVLLAYSPGEVANITFVRNGETLTVPVTLGVAADLVY